MSSRFRAILLLVALLWQILPVLSPLGVEQRTAELEHVSFHGLDIDHHHHDAQSLHVDDTGGTSMHFHADGEINTAGLLTTGWSHVATVQLPSPDMAADPLFPSAHPEGLRRPPPTHGLRWVGARSWVLHSFLTTCQPFA